MQTLIAFLTEMCIVSRDAFVDCRACGACIHGKPHELRHAKNCEYVDWCRILKEQSDKPDLESHPRPWSRDGATISDADGKEILRLLQAKEYPKITAALGDWIVERAGVQ